MTSPPKFLTTLHCCLINCWPWELPKNKLIITLQSPKIFLTWRASTKQCNKTQFSFSREIALQIWKRAIVSINEDLTNKHGLNMRWFRVMSTPISITNGDLYIWTYVHYLQVRLLSNWSISIFFSIISIENYQKKKINPFRKIHLSLSVLFLSIIWLSFTM